MSEQAKKSNGVRRIIQRQHDSDAIEQAAQLEMAEIESLRLQLSQVTRERDAARAVIDAMKTIWER